MRTVRAAIQLLLRQQPFIEAQAVRSVQDQLTRQLLLRQQPFIEA